ncbi:histidine utilization repressor [Thalassotalea piscium]|uniref:Histidine utilization repressor n=1 Tax=Thalassotalea piscium TaxID=1230533 RepID=A0A7X0TUR9_9GAMM|nr:histidine utilization repressor [Thalassotalea piscium]MBB6544667.1 GntR family histidine utilization transcriptional repressor [Thalassotalea piscium]
MSSTKAVKASKFAIIKQHICEKIESGDWSQHSKVPSENELAELFSVSRMTARRALQELTEQGLLVRTQGAGTFVATFKSQSSLLEIRNIADEIADRGHKHHANQLVLKSVNVSDEIAILLNIKPNQAIFYSEILHFENNEAIQLEQRYVNSKLVPNYLMQNFTEITPHEYLSHEAPLTEATHEIEAVLANESISKLLAINTQQPCLQVKRRTWSKQGVVSVAILTSPGNKYRLGSHLVF